MEQGPKQPLDEKDALIEQLKNTLASFARYIRANVLAEHHDPYLLTAVEMAEQMADDKAPEKRVIDWSKQAWWNE